MRILEIIPQLDSGGGERFTVDLCNELAKNHTVKLIVLFPLENNGFYANEISPNVEVVSMNKKLGLDATLPFKIIKEVKRFRPDIVHSHLRAINYIILSAFINSRIFHCHTVHNTADKEAEGFFSSVLRKFLFKCGFVTPITISKESHRSFVDYYHMDAPIIDNGRNIPKSLNVSDSVKKEIDTYRQNNGPRVIINLARLMEVKRQPLIAKVCRRLQDEGYKFTMLMIGRCESEEYKNRIEGAKCDFVHILGERKNPLEYLSYADGYCLMSSYEGMPISLIEALGTRTIPICTPVGGIVDVIESGKNGILATDLSEDACYHALKGFLDLSEIELNTMKINACKSYEPFSMTECANKYEHLYRLQLKSKH